MIDRELEELRLRAEAEPADASLWPALLARFSRAGRLVEGVELVRRCLSRAGGGERLERTFLGESFRAGFGLGDPRLQVPSGLVQVELAPDGRHLALGTARHGVQILETEHWSVRGRVPAAAAFHLVEFAEDGKALCLGLVESRSPDPGRRMRLVFWEDAGTPVLRTFTCPLPTSMDFRLLGTSEDWRHFRVGGAGDTVGMLQLADWRDPGAKLEALGFHRIGSYLPHGRLTPESLPPNLRVIMPDGWLEARAPRPLRPGVRDPGRPIWHPGATWLTIESPEPGGPSRAAPQVHARPIERIGFGNRGRLVLTVDTGGTAVFWSWEEGLPFLKLDLDPGSRILELAAAEPLALVQRGIHFEVFELATRQVRATGPAYDAARDPWTCGALSSDGRRVAYGTGGGRLASFEVGAPSAPREVVAHGGPVAACGFFPAGGGIWSLSLDDRSLAVHAGPGLEPDWRFEMPFRWQPGRLPLVVPLAGRPELLLSLIETPILLRKGQKKGVPLFMRPQGTGVYALSPNGRELAASYPDEGFTLWDLPPTGSKRKAWCREGWTEGLGPVDALAYSPCGRALLYAQSCHLRIHECGA